MFDKEKTTECNDDLGCHAINREARSVGSGGESKGEAEATRIVDESSAPGTAMHKILEMYILEQGYADQTNVGKQAHNMAMQVINGGLSNVTEYYGTECTLYYPGLYAGQTDLVGVHKGQDAIIDLQTNKPKKREWIDDYFLQLSAYANGA